LERTTANFTITGEGLTNIARNMWTSHIIKNAIETITCNGLSIEVAEAVLTGKMKFAGDTSVNPELWIEDDDATHYHSSRLLTFAEMLFEKQRRLVETFEYLRVLYVHLDRTIKNEGFTVHGHTEINFIKTRIMEYNKKGDSYLLDIIYLSTIIGADAVGLVNNALADSAEQKLDEHIRTLKRAYHEPKTVNPISDVVGASPNLTTASLLGPGMSAALMAMTGMKEVPNVLEAEPLPEEIRPVSMETYEGNSGYIDRSGRFWPCSDLQHRMLAERLARDGIIKIKNLAEGIAFDDADKIEVSIALGADAEKAIDNLGWVKLSVGRFAFWPERETMRWTKKQIDTAMIYILKHEMMSVNYNSEEITLTNFTEEIS